MAAHPAFRDEILKDLEATLRKQNQLLSDQLEVLRESHSTQVELVGVMKDLRRVLTVKATDKNGKGNGG